MFGPPFAFQFLQERSGDGHDLRRTQRPCRDGEPARGNRSLRGEGVSVAKLTSFLTFPGHPASRRSRQLSWHRDPRDVARPAVIAPESDLQHHPEARRPA